MSIERDTTGQLANKASYLAAVTELKAAAAAYYAGTDSPMDDYTFDLLWADVAKTEEAHPEWVQGAPVTGKVAAGAVDGDVKHSRPMLSLDNTYSPDELNAWVRRVSADAPDAMFVVEPKLDGLALNLTYRDGDLTQITTRGDGLAGQDVTRMAHLITNIPKSGVKWDDGALFTAELRGECIFTHDQFDKANELRTANGDKAFINARNGVAGAVRGGADKPYPMEMTFICYDAVADYTDNLSDMTYFWLMAEVGNAGFSTANGMAHLPITAEHVAAEVARWEEHRHDVTVDTDGAVIKINDMADRTKLGMTGRAPRWAVAYKFAPEEVMSILEEVLFQIGRTGVITPRARITPVLCASTTITYTTLHNPGDMARKGFMIGDHVIVKRAGEVIPRLEAPVVGLRTGAETAIVLPTSCPRCNGAIDKSGERWRCARGRNCGMAEAIAYAASRDALDIEGMSTSIVNRLVETDMVSDLTGLFTLTVAQLADMPTEKTYDDNANNRKLGRAGQPVPLGETTAAKLYEQILKARNAAPNRVICALGLRMTGRSISRRLAARFGTLSGLQVATETQLAGVDKVGDIKAAMIREQLDELEDVVNWLINEGIGETVDAPRDVVTPGGSPAGTYSSDSVTWSLIGATVVVTGSMKGALGSLSRNEVNELIEKLGGKSSGSVSKNTSLLVVGENAGSKLAKATELGVPVLTEAEFATKYGVA